MNQSKKFHLINCPNCYKRFTEDNLPKILPCGKTLCQVCEKILLQFDRNATKAFKCKLCTNEHQLPKVNSFPTNEILWEFLMSAENTSRNKPILKAHMEPGVKMNLALNQLEINANKLDASIENLESNLKGNYTDIKQKINSRTEQLVTEINKARDQLIEDLKLRQQVSSAHIKNNREKIGLFHKECKDDLKR